MTCARRIVTATLITPDGRRFIGRNDCDNPQATCPRLPAEGYGPCASVCRQPAHAEVAAIRAAGPTEARGAVLYVEGHSYICRDCRAQADAVGARIVLGSPP